MIIILDEDLIITDQNGEKLIELKAGMEINTIRFEYVPKESFKDKLSFQIEKIKKDAYIIYIRGKFIAVPKNLCTVPKSVGWRANI